jgi:hypothetical protein
MTSTAPDGPPPPGDLAARVFRALYPEFDLHVLPGTYLAIPAGTPCYAAPALGEIACQISGQDHQAPPDPGAASRPDLPRRP